MKRRYKLLLIILVGAVATLIINSFSVKSKTSLVALGDGFSLGMTPYNVAGTSFNDYLKEKLESRHEIDDFNNDFSITHLTIHELNGYLKDNVLGKNSKIPIKQIIAKAEIITIAIGIDELADKSLVMDIGSEQIDNYIKEMSSLLKQIREFYDKEIIVIGLYPAYKLSQKDVVDINKQLQVLCGKYNSLFLDVLAISVNPDYYLAESSYYMNYKAHEKIAKMLYVIYKK